MKLIVSGDEVVAWVEARLDHRFKGECIGLGLHDGKQIVAGAVYDQRRDHDVHVHVSAERGSITRTYIHALYDYPFNRLGVRRISASVRVSNLASMEFCRRFGFRIEGIRREGYFDGEDEILMGLLKEDFRWRHSL